MTPGGGEREGEKEEREGECGRERGGVWRRERERAGECMWRRERREGEKEEREGECGGERGRGRGSACGGERGGRGSVEEREGGGRGSVEEREGEKEREGGKDKGTRKDVCLQLIQQHSH